MKQKKSVLIGMFCMLILALSTISWKQTEKRNDLANVNRIEGYYIFVDSKPATEYEFLGTVEGRGVTFGSGQYTDVRNSLIDRAKKQYPRADGLIFYFVTGAKDKCEAIKFKD